MRAATGNASIRHHLQPFGSGGGLERTNARMHWRLTRLLLAVRIAVAPTAHPERQGGGRGDDGERSTGYWAKLLRERGVAVTAYDLHPTGGEEHNGHHAMDLHGDATKRNPPPFTTGAPTGCQDA